MTEPDPRKEMEAPWRNKEKLQQLAKDCKSKIEIAEKLDTSRKTIGRWMNRLNVEMVDPPWRDESTLFEAYNRLGNQEAVANEMGASITTIITWMDKHGIESKKDHPGRDLYDENKMRQYYEEEQSISGVAERLKGNPGNGSVIKWLDKHGIETNQDHATRGKQILVECDNCGSEERVYESTVQNKSWYCSRGCMAEDQALEITPERPYRGGWKSIRKKVYQRDENECQVCGEDKQLHAHHIVPVRKFDTHKEAHKFENLVTVCNSCHGKLEQLPEAKQREMIE